jgi:hypothetical protein
MDLRVNMAKEHRFDCCHARAARGEDVFGGTPNTASETLALLFHWRILASSFCLCFRIMAQAAKSVHSTVVRIF